MSEARNHGLHSPWDPLQAVAIFAYVLFIIDFSVFHGPMLPLGPWRFSVVPIFSVWCLFSILSYIAAALSAPFLPLSTRIQRSVVTQTALEFTCERCQIQSDFPIKHCYRCHRCVGGFDHHCRWLNTCVAAENYNKFIVFITNTLLLLVMQFVINTYFIVEYFTRFDTFRCRLEHFSTTTNGDTTVAAFLIASGVLEVATLLLLGHLVGFHVYLKCKGMSTYQLLLQRRHEEDEERLERIRLGMSERSSPVCHSFAVAMWKFRNPNVMVPALVLDDPENVHELSDSTLPT